MVYVIHVIGVSVNGFMAEVVTNDKFSGLYISTYGNGQQQQQQQQHDQQHQQQHLKLQNQQQKQQEQELQHESQNCSGDGGCSDVNDTIKYNMQAFVGYADSLAMSGRVCESLTVYARCLRVGPLPTIFLWTVTSSFIELIRKQVAADETTTLTSQPLQSSPFNCGVCDLVLRDPVTLVCGHTFCRQCVGVDNPLVCNECGSHTSYQPQSNVLVKSLVEKLWPVQLRTFQLMDEGKALYRQDKLHTALLKFNQAYDTGYENYDLLNIRSKTLLKLGLNENALFDADRVVQTKPKWSKGHFTRGMVLFSLGQYHEALLEYSLSAVLGENIHKLKSHINEVLQRLLIIYSKETDDLELENWNSISHNYSFSSYLNPFIDGSNQFENNTSALILKPFEHNNTFLEKSLGENNKITGLIQQILVKIFQTIKDYNTSSMKNNNTLNVDKSLLDESDFNCVLCCGMFRNPVTTPCGHTYCMDCLEHNFDYSFHCPLCLTAILPSLALSKKNIIKFVEALICLKFTKSCLMRMDNWKPEVTEYDNTYLPVFVCINAFPSVSCPLHAFEPRYRLMIRRCIESGTRRFAMISHCCPPMKFAEYGTVLEIKDRIMMGNGSSFISTIGTQRFKVLVRKEHDGYDMAKVQYIQDEKIHTKKLSELKKIHDEVRHRGLTWFNSFRPEIKAEILRTVGFPPSTEDNWEQLVDGPAWTWWLLSLLPLGANVQVDLLANTSIEVRLKVINTVLSRIERSSLSRINSSPI